MRKFGNPYLSSFMALLILVLSCQQSDESIENTGQQLTMKEFIAKHLSISESIVELFKNEKSIDVDILLTNLDSINNEAELIQILKSSNINNYNELASLFQHLVSNSEMFIKSNPEFYHLNKEERLSILSKEIDLISNSSYVQQRSSGSCEETRATAENRCARNYAIATAASLISGFITLGWGTAIGFAAAQVMLVVCLNDANNDYENCLSNQY